MLREEGCFRPAIGSERTRLDTAWIKLAFRASVSDRVLTDPAAP
jgi:hypothetical protein